MEDPYGGDQDYSHPDPPKPIWTDPDTEMPDWLHDPNAPPSSRPPPPDGLVWKFENGMWTLIKAVGGQTTPTNTPPPNNNSNNGGTPVGGVPLTTATFRPFESSASPRANFGAPPAFNAPRFDTPAPFAYDKNFSAPTAGELQNDPSFQFRMDQGRKALEQSAAGKGVLRTGGTLKDLVNYGQDFASNEYGNVYNRKFDEYKFDYDKEADIYARNYGVKRDVFDRNYKAAYDEYQPTLTGWTTNANADQRAAEMTFESEWQRYIADRNYDLEKKKLILNP